MALIQPRGCLSRPFRPAPPPGTSDMAALKSALWPSGTLFRILFGSPRPDRLFGGTRAQRNEVVNAANIIAQHANVHFAVIDKMPAMEPTALRNWLRENPVIRCSFDPSLGSWSYIGKEIGEIKPGAATMNIGWPNDLGRSIHELMHALGCEHEHQSFDIPWNVPAAYAYFEGPPNDWTEEQVQIQVLRKIDPKLLVRTPAIDVDSIMMYPFPPQIVPPRYVTDFKSGLSPGDIAMMKQLWPS